MKQTGAPASSPHARHAKRRWRACVRPNGLTGVTGDLRKEAPLLLLPAVPSVSPPLGVTSLLHARHQELIFPRARPASGVCGSESERVIFTPAAIELAALACAQTPSASQAKSASAAPKVCIQVHRPWLHQGSPATGSVCSALRGGRAQRRERCKTAR